MPLEQITESDFREHFDINVLGTILVTQAAVRQFNPGGSVINIGSLASRNPSATQALYAATKAGMNALTSVLAFELAPRRIRVNAILPGYTDTEGARAFGVAGTEYEKQLLQQTPLGRAGVPADIASVAGNDRSRRRLALARGAVTSRPCWMSLCRPGGRSSLRMFPVSAS